MSTWLPNTIQFEFQDPFYPSAMEEVEHLADAIGEVLLARKQTVAVAEATSGGLVTGKLLLLE